MESWLADQRSLAGAVAAALIGSESVFDELKFVRELPCSEEALIERMKRGKVLDRLAACLVAQISVLQKAEAATVAELHAKFDASQFFTLQMSGLDKFYNGLEGLVGPPSPHVYQGMQLEHCGLQDATTPFDMPNRKARTTSIVEWRFVVCPEMGQDGKGAPFPPYPTPAQSRKPLPLEHFETDLQSRNADLKLIGQPSVGREEFIGARLYTGPLYLKYNAVLRGLQFSFAKSSFDQLCAGNKYTNTLHALNSAIIKLSKLTKAAKVYRGVSGGVLPDACRVCNSYGVKGGVEGGFMSTTTNMETALFYASGGADKSMRGGPAIVFESQMGMVDRGADVAWLSEFPHEAEILFAPLTGIEMRGSRVMGAVQVYEVNLTINTASQTLEQVLSKRRKMLLDMSDNMEGELLHDLDARGNVQYHFVAEGRFGGAQMLRQVKCRLTGVVIHGNRYVHDDPAYGSLCEEQFKLLPQGSGMDTWAPGHVDKDYAHYKPRQDDFVLVEPWSTCPAEHKIRAMLARTITHHLATIEAAEWYNSDANYKVAIQEALDVKQAMSATTHQIKLTSTLIREIPASIGQLSTIRSLSVCCKSLSWLPGTVGDLTTLVDVNFFGCSSLTNLPESIGNWLQLQSLSLQGCKKLLEVPSTLANCVQLKSLTLVGCDSLDAMPDLSNLLHLQTDHIDMSAVLPWAQGFRKAWKKNDEPRPFQLPLDWTHLDLSIFGPDLTNEMLIDLPKCRALQRLNMRQCTNITKMPDLSFLPSLSVKDEYGYLHLTEKLEQWYDGGFKEWTYTAPSKEASSSKEDLSQLSFEQRRDPRLAPAYVADKYGNQTSIPFDRRG